MEGEPGALETNQGTVTAQVTVAVALERLHLAAEQGSVKTDLAQLSSALASNRISVINEKLVTPQLKLLWENEATAQRIWRSWVSALPNIPSNATASNRAQQSSARDPQRGGCHS